MTTTSTINGFNGDADTRDKIIFNEPYDESKYRFRIREINHLDGNSIKKLIALNFIDPNDHQNYGPTVEQLLSFIDDHSNFTLSGYAVGKNRDDYRVSFDEIGSNGPLSTKDIHDFNKSFNDADEFHVDHEYARAWYD